MTRITQYYVDVIETATGNTVQSIGPTYSRRSAEQVERGVNINLNHEKFHTEVREE